MPKIRHFAWVCKEMEYDPSEYDYISDAEFLDMDIMLVNRDPECGFSTTDLTNVHALMPKSEKQFTIEHLRQLVAARGFTEVMCNRLEPDQIQDEGIRSRVAIIQHLLSEIWEKIDG